MKPGRKAESLQLLPTDWVPPFFAIDSDTVGNSTATEVANDIMIQVKNLDFTKIIIRSSSVDENLNQRGRFFSREFEAPLAEDIESYVTEISEQSVAAGSKMGLVVQKLLKVDKKGHLSNERRVSSTRNQWEVEIEYPRFESFRVNSQRDKAPRSDQVLTVPERRSLHRLFGVIGSWANTQFDSRVHFEWVIEGANLWIVQVDLEDDAPDEGIDPWSVDSFAEHQNGALIPDSAITHWTAFCDQRFRKIESIQTFAKHTAGDYPDVFVLPAVDAANLSNNGVLAEHLRLIVGERLVCRTDVNSEARGKMQGLNLPRTDTSDPEGVVTFIDKTSQEWLDTGLDLSCAIFIIHEYLPAITGAWADAAPGQRTVQIDALWGLPDGLQYLDHDSFEYDLKADQIVSEYIRHKAWFVAEERDGSWRRKSVRRDITRHSAISRDDVSTIARVTHELAVAANSRLRVMWFVDVRKGNKACLFPWFAHTPEFSDGQLFDQPSPDQSLMRSWQNFSVHKPTDLDRLPVGRLKLRLDPDAEHMRDNKLIERIADLARTEGHAVELRGSGLCHAYYLLKSFGVPVVTPHTRKHTRVRGRQTFGKLVRDKIPERIQKNGERVRYLTIGRTERKRALAAKLIEEAQEVANSTNAQDIAAELADVLEIAKSVAQLENVDWQNVEDRAQMKREQVGSFGEAKYLIETDIPAKGEMKVAKGRSVFEPYQAKRLDGGVIVPFLSLIEDGVEFVYNGRPYSMRLRPEGVFLEELPEKESSDQLDLPLDS
ncbi:nucleoside triphosphate pyrophosphohydrolase [Rhizobium skierniewicense]|uniref:nucleoside triphosphate pyrophosphohydrolase n=1 Tax=Rhizobium skierniewicense TaxID=984260 RepID=UPI0015726C0D|nr:nucleoside triphosphate pyrophosphohydrolase [Rhizobium skierniewicense]NTF35081.1 nucleoside triphosphate pyrophosphohydrolase [Rhizobium skierniewicense]